MSANTPGDVAQQYATDQHLRTRIQIHSRYSVGQALEPAVDSVLALRGTEALLDVGTGPGDFPGRVRAAGHTGRVVGADLSAGMIETARAAHPGVEFVLAPADILPFPDGTFDVVTARHMLYHVPDVPAALSEFRRVLRPGGRFVALTNTAGYMAELWDMVAQAAATETVLVPLSRSRVSFADAFSEENGEAWVRGVFGNASVSFCDAALLFGSPDPVVAYLASTTEWQKLSAARSLTAEGAVRAMLAPRFQAGPWQISKQVVFVTADRR